MRDEKKGSWNFSSSDVEIAHWKNDKNVRRFGTWMSKTHGCVNPCYHVFGGAISAFLCWASKYIIRASGWCCLWLVSEENVPDSESVINPRNRQIKHPIPELNFPSGWSPMKLYISAGRWLFRQTCFTYIQPHSVQGHETAAGSRTQLKAAYYWKSCHVAKICHAMIWYTGEYL